MIALLFGVLGFVAGVVQAQLLSRAARRGPNPLSMMLRLLAVGAVLVGAAVAGHIFAAAAGWLIGYVASTAVAYQRLRPGGPARPGGAEQQRLR